ncbi:MAG: type I DNA topoisomerase [Bernardetiaceae bacterium]|nr:type I DNA topoisomerase [Bernardetiaceae bacterium]
MPKNLLIVESPAKAKTINKYLGNDFIVTSSYGHIRDLPKKNAIDIENGFAPTYEISPDKKQVISELKKHLKTADTVWLATDDDREGEAISWHLYEVLKLTKQNTKRIVFREITKNAILNAIKKPRHIDDDLVNAQQARRILDRLVGFELSPVLWKKIKPGLSAGRVQSVAVRIVVEREREIEYFKPDAFFKINADFEVQKKYTLKSELSKRLSDADAAMAFLTYCQKASFSIENLEKKPTKKTPTPPFTTSTLQQEASRKLGFSVGQTMSTAQRLYESGYITYMRTDSISLSQEAQQKAAAEIKSQYGQEYVKLRNFKTKSESAQEAHEAIRPTEFSVKNAGADRNQQRLYELIWKRAIASQMADAQIERTIATILPTPAAESIKNLDPKEVATLEPLRLKATGEVIVFDGFLKVYLESRDDEDEEEDEVQKGMLPPLKIGETLPLKQMLATERFTRAKPRYTEASLVKALEEMSIGRPSTYAPTISTIMKRNYVVKESREGKERKYKLLVLQNEQIKASEETENYGSEKMKLFPTNVGMVVNDFLMEYFPEIMDYTFTAQVEEQFDKIAQGKQEWSGMIANFYKDFHPKIEETEGIDRSELTSSREIGIDPKTGRKIIARLGRYGPLVELVSENEEQKSEYASLRKGQFIESLTLDDALELFKLPREVGEFEGEKMVAAIGRFGPYIRHKSKFYSLGKEHDPHSVLEDTAIEIIKAKREADAKKLIKEFEQNDNVKVLNGRYGPYISFEKRNIKIPKDMTPEDLTYEQCVELAENTPEKPTRGGKRKTAATTAADTTTQAKKKTTTTKKVAAKKTAAKKTTAKKKTTTTTKK